MFDITCSILHVRYYMFDITCSISHVRYHMFDITCSISHVRYYMFDITCSILHVRYYMFDITFDLKSCHRFTTCCKPFVTVTCLMIHRLTIILHWLSWLRQNIVASVYCFNFDDVIFGRGLRSVT